MNKISFTVDELCRILKACGEAPSLAELKFAGLYLRFGTPTPAPVDTVPRGTVPVEQRVLDPQAAKEIAEIQEQQATRALLQDEVTLRERQLAQMRIEDPELAERLLTEGDLIGDDEQEEAADP